MASSAKSVVETEVEAGSGQVYQYVETTVNGQTIRKESTQPGKLELEMEKVGESEPTVTFSQETISPSPTPTLKAEESPQSLITRIINFLKKLFCRLSRTELCSGAGLDKLVKIGYR